jgi:hypothetical protein
VKTTSTLPEQVHELYRLLRKNGISESDIAEAGCFSRQALNARGLDHPHAKPPRVLGLGIAVLRKAFQAGFISESLSILAGKEIKTSTALTAATMYSDITDDELQKLYSLETLINIKPLSGNMILATMQTLRTPQK